VLGLVRTFELEVAHDPFQSELQGNEFIVKWPFSSTFKLAIFELRHSSVLPGKTNVIIVTIEDELFMIVNVAEGQVRVLL